MRYTQSKEQSAELLRAALVHMGQHDAAFNPLTFAVWFEHAAGINARLTRSIENCLHSEPRLGDDTIARLYRDHVGEVDESAMQRASGELQQVMAGLAEGAASTREKAIAFGQQLGGLTQALRTRESAGLEAALSQMLTETAEMTDSVAALQQRVVAGNKEIQRLSDDLSRARDEALFDSLTRVLNRKGFDQKLQAMLDQPAAPGRSHCLVMLDIDHFKAVNDNHGHVMGDRVLQALGEVLGGCVSDPTHCVARYGGEEFAILLPQCNRDLAVALAQTCRERVKALEVRGRRSRDVTLSVTISAGVACRQPDDDAQSLIARADKALYAAKKAGRDRVKCL